MHLSLSHQVNALFSIVSSDAGRVIYCRDVQFEKALPDADGAYPAIAQAFAAHLRSKYPQLCFLNREDDMGIPGLRQSKLSYYPHHLVVKFWARLWEDDDED